MVRVIVMVVALMATAAASWSQSVETLGREGPWAILRDVDGMTDEVSAVVTTMGFPTGEDFDGPRASLDLTCDSKGALTVVMRLGRRADYEGDQMSVRMRVDKGPVLDVGFTPLLGGQVLIVRADADKKAIVEALRSGDYLLARVRLLVRGMSDYRFAVNDFGKAVEVGKMTCIR